MKLEEIETSDELCSCPYCGSTKGATAQITIKSVVNISWDRKQISNPTSINRRDISNGLRCVDCGKSVNIRRIAED